MAKTLADVMTASPHSVGLDQDLKTAKELLYEHDIRHLPVRKGGELVGVVSERDILLALAVEKKFDQEMTIEDVYWEDPKQFSPETPLKEVADLMAKERIGSVLVVENEKLVGIYTTVDACRDLAELL